MRIDVSGLEPAARPVAAQAAGVYLRHLGDGLVRIVAHGSAVKGGWLPGGSDIDLLLFAEPELLTDRGQLPLDLAAAVHQDLAAIDVSPFRYLQAYIHRRGDVPGPGLIPGAYHVVWGDGQVPLATAERLRQDAREALARLDPPGVAARLGRTLLHHGEGRLYRQVRLLCTDVWPTLYHLLCLGEADSLQVWRLTKPDAIAATDPATGPGRAIRAFYAAVTHHYAAGETPESAFAVLRRGMEFLTAVARQAGR